MEIKYNTTTVDELRAVTAKLAGMHQKMDCLVTLTPEQRKANRGRRIASGKLHLLQNRVAVAAVSPGLLPASFDLPKLERDTAITVALFAMLTVLGELWDSVADTLVVVGRPAVVIAATANSHIKLASTSARRLAPTERASKGRSPARQIPPALPPAPGAPAQPVGTVALLVEPAKKAAY